MVSRQLDIEINSKYFSTRKTNTEKYENPSLQIKNKLPSHCPLLKPTAMRMGTKTILEIKTRKIKNCKDNRKQDGNV